MGSNGRPKASGDLSALMPPDEWELHRLALDAVAARGLAYALGGGLAYSAYTGHWRNTKDLDLFILPRDRDAAVEAVTAAGFGDYYEREPYDREWIFRGYRDRVIVDLIWQMANYRTEVDETWMERRGEVEIHGMRVPLLRVEDLVFSKLYIVQRDRCDWPDLLSVLHARGSEIDWGRLADMLGPDLPLLGSLVQLFGWLCPPRARELPDGVWERLGTGRPEPGPSCGDDPRRAALLDSREWFAPTTNGRTNGHRD